MRCLVKKIFKKSLCQINEIDDEIRNQSYNPNPIFESFDKKLNEDVLESKKSIKDVKKSIHCTKK